jgi:hypothetical protein
MTLDFGKKRVTDFKSCRRVTLPSPMEGSVEAKLKTLEGGLEGAILKEEKRVKEKKENESKLTKSEVRGLESIREREKAGEGVYAPCDKSGKNSFIGREDFIEKVEEHINQDPIVGRKEVEKEERKMSAMASLMARALRMGTN